MGRGGEVLFFLFCLSWAPFFFLGELGRGGLVGCIRFDLRNRKRERESRVRSSILQCISKLV